VLSSIELVGWLVSFKTHLAFAPVHDFTMLFIVPSLSTVVLATKSLTETPKYLVVPFQNAGRWLYRTFLRSVNWIYMKRRIFNSDVVFCRRRYSNEDVLCRHSEYSQSSSSFESISDMSKF
jgi:hypothetical protein